RKRHLRARPQHGTTERLSVSSSGAQANGASYDPMQAQDGGEVSFSSDATNLAAQADTNASRDVFVRDRRTGLTTRESVSSSGVQANGDSDHPSVSPDGRYLAFPSGATNLVSSDTNGSWDVFLRDLSSNTTIRVSVAGASTQANNDSPARSWLSDYAAQIAFASEASNLVSGDTNAVQDIFVRDRNLATTERSSVSSSEAQSNGLSDLPSITGDGRYVGFASDASNLVSGDTNSNRDAFVRDRTLGTTIAASVSTTGATGNGRSDRPMIAGDGRYVVFHSTATNLVSSDTNAQTDVFLRDMQSGTTQLVSIGQNRPPSADLSVTPQQGDTSTTFTANITASDPDGDALTYEIDWGDGAASNQSSDTHQFSTPGTYAVTGTVTDSFGASASETETVVVCEALLADQCVHSEELEEEILSPLDSVPDPCDESSGLPSEVGEACFPVSPAVADDVFNDEALNGLITRPGRVLVADANVLQAWSAVSSGNLDCPPINERSETHDGKSYKDWKGCESNARERRFAKRVRDLANKPLAAGRDDGMNKIPDVILLQEVRTRDLVGEGNNLGIIDHLERLTHFDWEEAVSWDPVNQEDVPDHLTQAATAIIYNNTTMKQRSEPPSTGDEYIETTYTEAEGCDPDEVKLEDDEDGDGLPDCERPYWKWHAIASFRERIPGGMNLAVASVHLPLNTHLAPQTAGAKKAQWAGEIASGLETNFPDLNAYVIGGDFNIQKCVQPDLRAKSEPITCTNQGWWTTLDSDGYSDAVFDVHGESQDEMDDQYEDGLRRFRNTRIDFLWGGLGEATVERSSHDLSCGVGVDRPATEQNCDFLRNEERYADHRLLWSVIAAGG
ncbi:MAG: PKD domain-containing protein, partial [Acidobacteria bacterium]|nr:PKD domain-containing protein [Acidobacteriota bacterium]